MKIENIKITCHDGFVLAATLYIPQKLKAAVIIGTATGIKRGFYHSFASYLAENGYGVISYDNRCIGDSIQNNINNGNASLITWGSLDMPAVMEKLKMSFPNTSYHIVGHSAGGQLIGLMPNYKDIASVFNIACSSGSVRNMKMPYRLKAIFFMRVFIPLNVLFFNKSNSQWLGMGEPLPKHVAKQWAKWCNGVGYIATDFGKAVKTHYYNEINIPAQWIYAIDDDIANENNVKDMIRVFPNMKAEIIALNPKDYNLNEIGHMKFFSTKSKQLWSLAIEWFEKNTK